MGARNAQERGCAALVAKRLCDARLDRAASSTNSNLLGAEHCGGARGDVQFRITHHDSRPRIPRVPTLATPRPHGLTQLTPGLAPKRFPIGQANFALGVACGTTAPF
jgi:hypothetical protein